VSPISQAKNAFATARKRWPLLDHVIRMYGRYQADGGDRLAAAVTFYWFLSLFPILLLAISLLGYVYGDTAPAHVQSALGGYLPPQLVETIGTTLQDAKGKAGVIGLVGLLLSGLGWIDGLRAAIRSVWHQNVQAGNIVTQKLADIVALLGLFATVGASVAVTGAATAATGWVLRLLGLAETTAAGVFTQVLTYLLAGVVDVALFLYLFTRLPRVKTPLRRVLRAAVFGAVGFEILKIAGAFYVARTTTNGKATYGTFAVVVGLLLFLNLVSRLILLAAAYAVTAPGDSDVAPSGTADKEQARKAGIPEEYADSDRGEPAVLYDDGAPTPLRAAVHGRTPPQHEATQDEATERDRDPDAEPVPEPAPRTGPKPEHEASVRSAGRAGLVAMGAVLAGVTVYALRTVRQLRR
jgi:membrane protein